MKLTQDKFGVPRVEIEEKDIEDAHEIEKMMQSKGWQVLKGYENYAREMMIRSGKEGIKKRASRDLSDIRWAIINGFDEAIILAERIVQKSKELIDKKEEGTDE